jgi:hypothetical protein
MNPALKKLIPVQNQPQQKRRPQHQPQQRLPHL